jgi:hypothetical protein
MTSNTNTNVVAFPKNKIVRDTALNTEAVNKMKEKSVQNFADTITVELSDLILFELENFGVDTESAEFTKDFYFMCSILSALVYRSVGIKHEFHEFIDDKVSVAEVNEIISKTQEPKTDDIDLTTTTEEE